MKKLRNDILLILAILLLGIGLFVGWYFSTRSKGKTAKIYHGDELIQTVNLYKKETFTVKGDISLVTIEVNYGSICVTDSGCSNHICIQMGKKSNENETITCLPNRIYIVIVEDGYYE